VGNPERRISSRISVDMKPEGSGLETGVAPACAVRSLRLSAAREEEESRAHRAGAQ
jgi:hypothetical protein